MERGPDLPHTSASPSTGKLILLLLAFFAALFLVHYFDGQAYLRAALDRLRALGVLGVVLFVFSYILSTVLLGR